MTVVETPMIAAAIERLSTDTNVSIKQVAGELGYASIPAFSHAFRQVTGRTPTEFAQRVCPKGLIASKCGCQYPNHHDKLLCLIGAHLA